MDGAQENLKARARPFVGEGEPAEWKEVVVLGAHACWRCSCSRWLPMPWQGAAGPAVPMGCMIKAVGDLSKSVQSFVQARALPRCAHHVLAACCNARLINGLG